MESIQWIEQAWGKIIDKLEITSERIGSGFPHVSKEGTYDLMSPSWWTAGFWPGILWLAYRETGNTKYKTLAEECEQKMDDVLDRFYPVDHDAGFMWTLTSVANFKLTQDEQAKRRALIAASHLAGRFNMKGQFIRAWNGGKEQGKTGWSIIDCTMNLPLLYWASGVTEDPRFKHIAIAHADTVLREFVRPDGSTYHIVTFDPETGERTGARGGQGYAEESAWSRGNSWALYGLTLTYLHTREERFLQAAKRVAHFFLSNLPEDYVPHWDFRAPAEETDTPRDSSAGAIAASGLLELAELVDPAESRLYREAGTKILRSLYENYGAWDSQEEGMIVKGTGHAPAKQNIHVALIYGDYYFVEGITKLLGRKELFW